MGKELLRLIIESSGKSNKEFAIAIGVCPATINKWLSGENKISKNNKEVIRSKFKKQLAKLYK